MAFDASLVFAPQMAGDQAEFFRPALKGARTFQHNALSSSSQPGQGGPLPVRARYLFQSLFVSCRH
jgi:hypothetical protein